MEVDRESQNVLPFQGPTASYDEFRTGKLRRDADKDPPERNAGAANDQVPGSRPYPEFGGARIRWCGRTGIHRKSVPAILGAFLGRFSVKRVPNSHLIEVTFEAEDPQLAAGVVNAHLQNYIEQNFRSKYDATTQASTWLSSELEELRIKVEKSEDARIAYERQNQIWQIDEKQDITTQKLGDLSKAVTEAQTALAEKEALYRMAASGNVDALPAARESR